MKAKLTIIVIMALVFTLPGQAREDKNPVAENDYATARVMQTIEIQVLENDYAYDGHPFKVRTAIGGYFGTFMKTDTSIFYTAGFAAPFHTSVDSISYAIVDLENNLVSDFAKVYIEVTNDGFDQLDMNSVSCRINAYGLHFWDMFYGSTNPKYEAPKGSGISSIFSQALWIGGKDGSGDLHMAAERYRQTGPDYYGGPMMDSSSYNSDQDINWHKVWKLSADEISYHLQHWQDAAYEPVENIRLWPGSGDTSLGQARYLAPYFDRDGDGIYDPLKGDSPIIKGDQAIFVLNNDDRGIHGETGGEKLGVEIHTLYYAYDDPDSALSYTTFADQHIINRSGIAYNDLYIGHFVDFDIGNFQDDYVHCDTLLESAICFNGLPIDGSGNPGEYGEHPPAQSFTCLNYQMGGFVSFQNNFTYPLYDPSIDREYYNYLRGFWLDSTHITYGGTGHGGSIPCNYTYTGDPVSGTGWTELNSQNTPGDRRGLISSGPYSLNPGDTIHLEFAFVFARDYSGDNLSSLALLKTRIQQVRDFYQRSLGIIDKSDLPGKINIFPNPCRSDLFVDVTFWDQDKTIEYVVLDISGREVQRGKITPGMIIRINVSGIQPGIYLIKFIDSQASISRKLIKEDN